MFTGWYRDQDQDFNCKVSVQDQDLYKTNSGGLDFQDYGLEATRLERLALLPEDVWTYRYIYGVDRTDESDDLVDRIK